MKGSTGHDTGSTADEVAAAGVVDVAVVGSVIKGLRSVVNVLESSAAVFRTVVVDSVVTVLESAAVVLEASVVVLESVSVEVVVVSVVHPQLYMSRHSVC